MATADDAFEQLMRLAGSPRPDFVRIDDEPPAMATRFQAEAGAAAALAAVGTLAADLWTLRTGQTQQVSVSPREAGAALVSVALQVFEDPARAPPQRPEDAGGGGRGTPAMGFFPTKDGRHVFLHPSFPDSAAKLHRLMGSPADTAAVAAEALKWSALDLENAIAEAGVCGAMVRTAQEWDASEQGRILAARPTVEIIKIAEDIDTYDLSILPYEDCCTVFTPPSPKTKPNLKRARSYEARLDVEGLMQRALDGIEITEIHAGDEFLNQNQDVFAELL